MIDFSSNPFDLTHISLAKLEGMRFTDESESLKDEILELARHRSVHCLEFAEYMIKKPRKSRAVRYMFTPSVFSSIARACKKWGDEEILNYYLDAYYLVTPTLEDPFLYDRWAARVIDLCLRNHIKPDAVNEIAVKMMILKRIPVAYIVDKYLKGKPLELQEYVANSTYIYAEGTKEHNVSGAVDDQKSYDKLIRALYRICNQLRSLCRFQMQREYMELSWEAINAQEGTSFTPCFISWLKWAAVNAKFVGNRERNDGYPSWCFAPFSMDVCSEKEKSPGLDSLYDYICDVLGEGREKKVQVRLQSYHDGFPVEADFYHVCQRLVSSMIPGIYVDKTNDCIVIPAGKGIEQYRLIRQV